MSLDLILGEWASEMVRPETSAEPIRGRMVAQPLFGGHFVLVRTTVEHPEAPDSLVVIGSGEESPPYTWHYFDARGVTRGYRMTLADGLWTIWREDSDFWQRYTGRFSSDGRVITGAWEMSHDRGATWQHDFGLVHTKV